MKKFILKRVWQMLLVWFLVSVFSFAIIYFAPGDPLSMYMTPEAMGRKLTEVEMQELRASLGLDGNMVEQYVNWLSKFLSGNLGISLNNRLPVMGQILEKLPCTIGLMGASLVIALVLSIPLGLIAGANENKWIDNMISQFSYLGVSIPAFWLGIMLIVIFSMKLRWFPSSGIRTIGENSLGDLIRHAVLPAFVLSLNHMAVFVRYIRSNVIVQLKEEYVQTAISKGFSDWAVLSRHVLKNCMLPVITIAGSRLSRLISGSFIIESVFAWPGLGTLGVNAVNGRDYPMIMGITMFSCTLLLLGNLIADLLYGFADPRIKLGKE